MWNNGDNSYSVSVVMAAANEESTIGEVLDQLFALRIVDRVIIVDDNSTDDTASIAIQKGCEVISNRTRIGQTRSLRKGIDLTDTDLLVTMDADKEHVPSDMLIMLYAMKDSHADIVIGGRSSLPRISERILSLLAHRTIGVKDTLSGFKLISRNALHKVAFDNDDTWGSLFLVRCAKRGLKIIEVPISTPQRRTITRTGGSLRSNMRVLNATGKFILCLLGIV